MRPELLRIQDLPRCLGMKLDGELYKCREIPVGSEEFAAAWALRCAALLDPYGIDRELAREDDARARHFVLMSGHECMATLMLVPLDEETFRMRQVAVRSELRRRGWGRRLLAEAEAALHAEGGVKVIAHVRDEALSFYVALGYEKIGEPFEEVGLMHHLVQKFISGDER